MRRMLLLAVLFAACDSPVKPYEPQLDVFCVLRTDDSHPVALVGRSVSYEDWNRDSDWNGVDGAAVVVTQRTDSFYLHSVPDTLGYYVAESLRARAGESYRLVVRSPDGEEVHGSTTAPGGFVIENISTAMDSGQLQVRLVWSPSQGATGYQLVMSSLYAEAGGDTLRAHQSLSSESCAAEFSTPLNWNRIALAAIGLKVCALDRNYQDYLTMLTAYGYRNTLMHLEGGLGVFGSICVTETTAYLSQLRRP